jgi:hypothetical protein
MIAQWLGPRGTSILLDVSMGLFFFAFLWGAVKGSYQRVTGHPMPRSTFTVLLDVLADLAVNIPGALNRLQPGLFWEPGQRIERVVSNNPQKGTPDNEST